MNLRSFSFWKYFFPSWGNHLYWLTALGMMLGILLLDWSPLGVIFAYFFETIIIGLIHLIKLFFVIRFGHRQHSEASLKNPEFNRPGILLFFFVHYFIFVTVQSALVFGFFEGIDPAIKSGFRVLENFAYLLTQKDMVFAVLMISFFQISKALRHFFLPGRFHSVTTQNLFFQPYVRILIQQFATISMGFFMFIPGAHAIGALLLIGIRLLLDLAFYAIRKNPELLQGLAEKMNKRMPNKPVKAEMLEVFLED
jgi:hypothetical protein